MIRELVLTAESSLSRFREALEAASKVGIGLAPAHLPEALAELERLRLILDTARIEAAARADRKDLGRDRVLDIQEAAVRLGRSVSFLYREAHRLPFTVRAGRSLGFSECGIEAWIRRGGAS